MDTSRVQKHVLGELLGAEGGVGERGKGYPNVLTCVVLTSILTHLLHESLCGAELTGNYIKAAHVGCRQGEMEVGVGSSLHLLAHPEPRLMHV